MADQNKGNLVMRVIFDKPLLPNAGLFEGQAWMDAAEAWALEQGWRVVQWQVNQRFRVAKGNPADDVSWLCWFSIAWQEGVAGNLGTWEVTAS
jgi:hypothetical protein